MTCYFSINFCGQAASSQELIIQNDVIQKNFNHSMMDSLVNNYLNIEKSGTYLISLFMAIILATIIAFHPQTFGNYVVGSHSSNKKDKSRRTYNFRRDRFKL
jgi:hypothetical protein